MEKIIHFGVEFKESKYNYMLTRDTYIPNLTESIKKLYTEKELKNYIQACYKNYDLNIRFFNNLDPNKFNEHFNSFLAQHKEFKQIYDLNEIKNQKGYYILVLDNYKQLYLGTSNSNIYKRVRKHMSDNQPFDRLIWTDWDKSKLSINSFRPLDITRIYVYLTEEAFYLEDFYINCFKDEYILNRTMGGYLERGIIDASMHAKSRKLV